MIQRQSAVDDYGAAQGYATAPSSEASTVREDKYLSAWSRRDWPVAVPILGYWSFLAVFGVYDWWCMLTPYDVPPGYLIIPLVRLLLFGGPAVLAWLYHPSAFQAAGWYFAFVVGNFLTESDPYSVWHYVNLLGSCGVLIAGWLSKTRIRQPTRQICSPTTTAAAERQSDMPPSKAGNV